MNHRDAMARKIALLRSTGVVEELERRWEDADEDPPYATYTVVELADGAEPSRTWPGGLDELYRLTSAASFGGVEIRPEDQVAAERPVDSLGEPIDDRQWLRIGDIGYEDALLMDAASGEVIIYVNSTSSTAGTPLRSSPAPTSLNSSTPWRSGRATRRSAAPWIGSANPGGRPTPGTPTCSHPVSSL